MSQPNFNHPELVVKTVPTVEWNFKKAVRFSNDFAHLHYSGKGKMTRIVFLKSNLEKLEEIISKDERPVVRIVYGAITYEDFHGDDGHVVYRRKIRKTGEIHEKWFHDKGTFASRRTVNGKLSCTKGPAVVIQRSNGLRREEFWHDGILSQVAVVSDTKGDRGVVVQNWKDGKCIHQYINPERMTDLHPKDLVVLDAKSKSKTSETQHHVYEVFERTEPEKEDVPSLQTPEKETLVVKTFNLTSAQEARNEFSKDEGIIQNILERFETRRRDEALKGNRRINIQAEHRFIERLVKIVENAGYIVENSSLSKGSTSFWVSY